MALQTPRLGLKAKCHSYRLSRVLQRCEYSRIILRDCTSNTSDHQGTLATVAGVGTIGTSPPFQYLRDGTLNSSRMWITLLWPELPHISLCVPARFTHRSVPPSHLHSQPKPNDPADVDTPDKYGLFYTDLDLKTEDGVLLRSYLLTQRKEVGHRNAMRIDVAEEMSNEEVCALPRSSCTLSFFD